MKAPIAALLAAMIACTTPPTDPIEHYVVVKRDTLGVIAKAHGVSVDDLRAWNHLTGDRIEIGQILDIQPGAATPPPVKKARRSSKGSTVSAQSGTPSAPLALPPAQKCLAGPSDVAGDEGMAASTGLSLEQLRAAMGGFVGNTLRCLPEGGLDGTIDLSITVACTGRVASVRAIDDGGVPHAVVSCVTDTLRYTPFPAHDMPDGFEFEYPLTFTAGGGG